MKLPTLFLAASAAALLLLALAPAPAEAQFFRNLFRGVGNFFRPVMSAFQPQQGGRGNGGGRPALGDDGGTKKPQATGHDNPFPDDCGRDEDKKGKLCFPDALLCQKRIGRRGNKRYGNHVYWFSWQSDDPSLNSAEWDWFNARNYCRKRCMDLVSIETADEYAWLQQQMGGVKYFWTSGRLCDFGGCDRGDFSPKHINGWFWSANQVRLSPTNCTTRSRPDCFHDWSFTGGSGVRQPDQREQKEGGSSESCMAVLNNFYGDGVKWHDVACEHEKPIICEDVEGHLQFARSQFPNIQIP